MTRAYTNYILHFWQQAMSLPSLTWDPDLKGKYGSHDVMINADSNMTCIYLPNRRDDWNVECNDETFEIYLASDKPGIGISGSNLSVIIEDDDG